MVTLKELLEERKALDAKIKDAQKTEHAALLDSVAKTLSEAGVTFEAATKALGRLGHLPRAKAKTVSVTAPMYRHNATGATWTGKGRKPNWFSEGDVFGGAIEKLL